jgi:hypothetical protein
VLPLPPLIYETVVPLRTGPPVTNYLASDLRFHTASFSAWASFHCIGCRYIVYTNLRSHKSPQFCVELAFRLSRKICHVPRLTHGPVRSALKQLTSNRQDLKCRHVATVKIGFCLLIVGAVKPRPAINRSRHLLRTEQRGLVRSGWIFSYSEVAPAMSWSEHRVSSLSHACLQPRQKLGLSCMELHSKST